MNILRKIYIRLRAQRILARMGIERPPVRAQEVAEAMYYKVRFVDFVGEDMKNVLGLVDPSERTIFVAKSSTPREMQTTIATELGKAILFPDWCADDRRYRLSRREGGTSREEIESSWFALCLLVPRRWVLDLRRHATDNELEKMFVADRARIMRSLAGIAA